MERFLLLERVEKEGFSAFGFFVRGEVVLFEIDSVVIVFVIL